MHLKSVCLFVVVFTVAHADQCCPPSRWQADTFYTRLKLQNNVASYYWELGEFYQDVDYKRYASVVERRYYGNVEHLKIISDHQNMLKYTIDSDRNTCSVEYNHDSFQTFCVPDSATPGVRAKLGFGDNSLDATAYYDTLKDDKARTGGWYIVNEACIPILGIRNGLDKETFIDSESFGSITTDYDDSIFNIPSICPTVIPPKKKKTMNFFEVIRYRTSIEKLNPLRL